MLLVVCRVTTRTAKPIDQLQVGKAAVAAVLMAGDDNRKLGWLRICFVGTGLPSVSWDKACP